MAACETVRARFVRGPRARGGPASGATGAAGAACAWCEGLNKADAEHELGFAFGRPHQPHPPHLVRQASHHTPSMVQRPMHVVFYNWCAAPLCAAAVNVAAVADTQPDLELLREPCSTYWQYDTAQHRCHAGQAWSSEMACASESQATLRTLAKPGWQPKGKQGTASWPSAPPVSVPCNLPSLLLL